MQLYLNYTANVLQMLPGELPNVAGWAAYRPSPLSSTIRSIQTCCSTICARCYCR
ncbi:MAG: hypothetical protein ACR2K1_11980 [Saprospiraceae bacterium]